MELFHFEDLALGGSWTTRGRTLTESDIVNHAGTSGDWSPLHVNQELASAGHFGTRVAHGALLISLAMGLGAMDVPHPATVGLVGTGWRFMRPVRIGDTIRAHYRLSRKRDVDEPRWGLVVWRIEITNQRQEIVAEGELTVLVAKREVPHVSMGSPASKRRRRGRRGKDPVAPAAPLGGAASAAANLPEPAPSDAPPARVRRRTPATPGQPVNVQPEPDPVDQVVPSSPAPADEAPQPSASARRRRRRRGSGGGGGTNGTSAATSPDAVLPVPPTAEHPVYVPEKDTASAVLMTTPGPLLGAPTGDDNPIGQILKRFRRPRQAPLDRAPGDTR